MAKTLYLDSVAPTTWLGNGHTSLATGSAAQWYGRAATEAGNGGGANYTANTANGAVTGIEFITANNAYYHFISPPVASAVTISGTITFHAYAAESDMKANATVGYYIDKVSAVDLSLTGIIRSAFGTELGTSAADCSWTGSPVSTALAKGDRIRIVPYIDDATSQTLVTGYTASIRVGDSQSYVIFDETFSFLSFSGAQYIYPTNTASDVATADVDYKIWTSRGT